MEVSCGCHSPQRSPAVGARQVRPDTNCPLLTPTSEAQGTLFSPSPNPFTHTPTQNGQQGRRTAVTEWWTPGTEPPAGPRPRGTALLPANRLLSPALRGHSCLQRYWVEAYQPLCSCGLRDLASTSCSRSAGQLSSLKCPARGLAVNGSSFC